MLARLLVIGVGVAEETADEEADESATTPIVNEESMPPSSPPRDFVEEVCGTRDYNLRKQAEIEDEDTRISGVFDVMLSCMYEHNHVHVTVA